MDWLVFATIAITTAVMIHVRPLLYQLIVRVELGHTDKFIAIAFVSSSILGSCIAAVTGGLMRGWMRRYRGTAGTLGTGAV